MLFRMWCQYNNRQLALTSLNERQEIQRQDCSQANPYGDEPVQGFDPREEIDHDDDEYGQEGGGMPDRSGQKEGEDQLDPSEVNVFFISQDHRTVSDDAKYRQRGEIVVVAFPEKGEAGDEKFAVYDQSHLKPNGKNGYQPDQPQQLGQIGPAPDHTVKNYQRASHVKEEIELTEGHQQYRPPQMKKE